tara:strand:+ start:64 stop:408 length:345 start_codon:yes stop_codon:yes gene_type:complete
VAAFIFRTCARLVFLITAALLISLAVKNRQMVSFYFNPLNLTENGPALEVPLFLLLVGAVMLGVLLGIFSLGLDRFLRRRSAGGSNGAPVASAVPSSDLPERDGVLKKTPDTKS